MRDLEIFPFGMQFFGADLQECIYKFLCAAIHDRGFGGVEFYEDIIYFKS